VVGFNWTNQVGLIDFLIFIAVLVAVWFQSRERDDESATFSFIPKPRPVPERLKAFWWMKLFERSGLILMGVVAVLLPIVVTEPSRHLLYATMLAYAICGMSLTVLTGWAGQVSLGQMAFAGIGALIAASLRQGVSIDIGWHHSRLINTSLHGQPFWVCILIAAVCTALLAAAIGVGSLRVRGLLLAVTTFAFALAAQQYLYRRPILNGHADSSTLFPRGDLFGIKFTSERSYYFAVLVVLVAVVWVVTRLRKSGVARRMIAVRDNPDGAAAYTVSPSRAKMQAFTLAGFIAGLGGALLAGVVQAVPFTEEFFLVNDSLVLVSLVVIGGVGSTTGSIIGALWIIGIPAFAPSNQTLPLLTSSLGLLVLLMYFPSGLVGVAYRLRESLIDWMDKRLPDQAQQRPKSVPTRPRRAVGEVEFSGDALVTKEVSVRFGGLVAVDTVSIRMGPEEVVGLIGANGAGKSTLMNAIGGYVTSRGAIELLGRDVSSLSPAGRAARGLGRTFQAASLFPELTVRETVQVALESRSRTSLIGTAVALPRSVRAERAKRAEAAEIIDFLGLGRYAEHYISDLSTGTRRVVELAALLALSARVMCLDEPTAGVAQRETEAFGPLLLEIRQELRASLLVIEHDMPLVMGISDRIYCLEAGRVISEGTPAEVRSDSRVVASYLGTDERAIARSGGAAE
jgi:ABC-type branched-subunit amino acid transport system ATPase component/ABC-type branched-subunit amino acid transport system permease subunit